ncbi:MAG: DoxX family membrane protein [Nanoarchaeota archaeon]|nr:DoxX family membrane protein [Nanoarchaeota archaeon]
MFSWNNKKLVLVLRLLLGAILVVFGLNGFFGFLPSLGPMSAAAGNFFGAIAATGYFLPVLKSFEILIGLMFLFNRAVPLATLMLVPISLNITLFHLALAPAAGGAAYAVAILNLYFVLVFKKKYMELLKA